jgi:geranylgeranylglycerol-phosphate geranylgeranyltransferase
MLNIKKIFGFIRLLRPEISIFGMLCVYIGAIASGSNYLSYNIIYGMFAVFFIGAGSMPFNDYFDWEIDKLNHPNRPLSSGLFKPNFGLHVGIIFFAIGIIFSYLINILCLTIASIAIILIIIYEVAYKNKAFIGNIIVAFTTAISFTYGGAIIGELIKPTFFTLISFFIFLGREIIMDVRDFEGDKITRITLPIRVGRKPAASLGSILIIISMILFFLPSYLGIFNYWYLIFAIPVALITIYSIIILYQDINNAGKTSNILRISMAAGLIIFIVALI